MRFTLGKHLVWRSTPASIAAGMPSLCAILEIPLALALYFSLAYFAGWWTPLLIAAVAAPLVLLRSDASVERAVMMAEGYFQRDLDARPVTRGEKAVMIGAAVVLSAIVSWLLAKNWLTGYEDWALFWRSLLVVIVAMNTSFALGVALVATDTAFKAVGVVATVSNIVAQALDWVAVNVGVHWLFIIFGPGYAAGTCTRCLIVRIASVFGALREGSESILENWRRTMLYEDSFHDPELIPGASIESGLPTFKTMTNYFFDPFGETGFQRYAFRMYQFWAILFWFTPAIIWRFALKSTFWLYGPLLFIAHPHAMGGEIERRTWLSRREDLWERHQRWLATGAAVVAIVMLTDLGGLIANLYETSGKGIPFLLTWALSLDLGTFFAQPWRWFSLANLVMAMVIFYWRDRLRARVQNGEEFVMTGWPVGWLVRFARAQVVVFVLYWLVSIFYLLKYAAATGRGPEWLSGWLA